MPKKIEKINSCYMLWSKRLNRTFVASTNEDIQLRIRKNNGKTAGGKAIMKTDDWKLAMTVKKFCTLSSAQFFESQLKYLTRGKMIHGKIEKKVSIAMNLVEGFQSGLQFEEHDVSDQ